MCVPPGERRVSGVGGRYRVETRGRGPRLRLRLRLPEISRYAKVPMPLFIASIKNNQQPNPTLINLILSDHALP